MGEKTKIEWAESSWNPLRGVKGNWHCTHVSEGCRRCYAERMNVRMGGPAYKPSADQFRLDEKILGKPLRWRRPRRIFVCSMTDLFHEDIPLRVIAAVFGLMALSQRHIFQVLTKRPEKMRGFLEECDARIAVSHTFAEISASPTYDSTFDWPLPNVWLGVSVEDQKRVDERVPILLATPAAVRWISYEPALGPISLVHDDPYPWVVNYLAGTRATPDCDDPGWDDKGKLDWVVCGGESGPGARPMHPDWARSVRDQCQAAGVPFFFKQWGEWADLQAAGLSKTCWKSIETKGVKERMHIWNGGEEMSFRIGKKAAGRLLDGRGWNEYPG